MTISNATKSAAIPSYKLLKIFVNFWDLFKDKISKRIIKFFSQSAKAAALEGWFYVFMPLLKSSYPRPRGMN